MTDALQRQININIQLRRQLEACRRDVVEECAKFCEDHFVSLDFGAEGRAKPYKLQEHDKAWKLNYAGDLYAKGLRGIIGR
jgi:hypothetical protein